MANLFDALGKAVNFFGEGLTTEQFGPDWRKKKAMLDQLNEIKVQGAAQDVRLKDEGAAIDRIGTAAKLASLGVGELPEPVAGALSPSAVGDIRKRLDEEREFQHLMKFLPYEQVKADTQARLDVQKSEGEANRALREAALAAAASNRGNKQWLSYDSEGRPQIITPEGMRPVPGGEKGGFGQYPSRPLDDTTRSKVFAGYNVMRQLAGVGKGIKSMQGPLLGRISNIAIRDLGGAGVPEEVRRQFLAISNLRTDSAFLNGGKQLTGTEYEQFLNNLPNENDTVAAALTKLKFAAGLTRSKYTDYFNTIDKRQSINLPSQFWKAAGMVHPSEAQAPEEGQ